MRRRRPPRQPRDVARPRRCESLLLPRRLLLLRLLLLRLLLLRMLPPHLLPPRLPRLLYLRSLRDLLVLLG